MTYTIVARDKTTGQFGVAVQTHNLAVGAWVPWAQGGVGAVGTQARALRSYGTSGLKLMGQGHSAQDTLNALLAVDPDRDVRQVGMVDRFGSVAVHTGQHCFPQAGTHTGDQYCTLANMMLRNTVWDAMAAAYETTSGDFADRLLAALRAAQAEGGDMRGKQTAALLIVDSEPNPIPLVDLRVDYDPDPVEKLAAIHQLNRAYSAEYSISELAAAGDHNAAHRQIDFILDTAPSEHYLSYLCALHLAGELDEQSRAVDILRGIFAQAPIWRDYLEREAAVNNFGIPGLGQRLLDALED